MVFDKGARNRFLGYGDVEGRSRCQELRSDTGIFAPSTGGTGLENKMASNLSQYANSDPHLSSGERVLSVLLGLGLTSVAAQPRSNLFASILALAAGSYLAYRGATGYCVIKASLGDEGHAGHEADRR